MIWCLSEPSEELRSAVATLKSVAQLALEGNLRDARTAIDSIDEAPLRLRWSKKNEVRERQGYVRFQRGALEENERTSPPRRKQLKAIYERDGWHCRYCQIEVIDPVARERLVKILNPLGPTRLWSNKDPERQAALLNLSASYDHVEARSSAATSDEDNLVTACWYCQFGKGAASLELLDMRDPRDRPPVVDEWDGWMSALKLKAPATVP